jgi:hypothetical protein
MGSLPINFPLGVSLSRDLPLYVVFRFWASNAQDDVMIANTIDDDGVLQKAVGAFPYCGTLILGGLKVLIGLGLGYGSRVL